jgi:hypothetical protein
MGITHSGLGLRFWVGSGTLLLIWGRRGGGGGGGGGRRGLGWVGRVGRRGGVEVGWMGGGGRLFSFFFFNGFLFLVSRSPLAHTRTYTHTHISMHHPIHHRYYSVEITENPPPPPIFFFIEYQCTVIE